MHAIFARVRVIFTYVSCSCCDTHGQDFTADIEKKICNLLLSCNLAYIITAMCQLHSIFSNSFYNNGLNKLMQLQKSQKEFKKL